MSTDSFALLEPRINEKPCMLTVCKVHSHVLERQYKCEKVFLGRSALFLPLLHLSKVVGTLGHISDDASVQETTENLGSQ